MCSPRASSYLKSRLLGYVTIGYIEPRAHYLGIWNPRVCGVFIPKRLGACGECVERVRGQSRGLYGYIMTRFQ